MTVHRRRLRVRLRWRIVPAVVLALAMLGVLAIWSNAVGVGDKFASVAHHIELIVNPPPDRPIEAIVHVTPPPLVLSSPSPTSTPAVASPETSGAPTPSAKPSPTPTPAPVRAKVDVNLLRHPDKYFISQMDKESCAVAGTQIALAIWGKAPLTVAFQRQIESGIGNWESRRDSLNGGWGPAAVATALKAYGVPGYQVRAYDRRVDALNDAARAISEMHAPVLLMAWRGAHTWVMTGYRASADPTVFPDARVTGAYILDPWYPRISSIWGPSDPPGTFQDWSEMVRNYLPWKRPEGHYPDRDGLFIAVVPTRPLNR
jgi:hypothetical protein